MCGMELKELVWLDATPPLSIPHGRAGTQKQLSLITQHAIKELFLAKHEKNLNHLAGHDAGLIAVHQGGDGQRERPLLINLRFIKDLLFRPCARQNLAGWT